MSLSIIPHFFLFSPLLFSSPPLLSTSLLPPLLPLPPPTLTHSLTPTNDVQCEAGLKHSCRDTVTHHIPSPKEVNTISYGIFRPLSPSLREHQTRMLLPSQHPVHDTHSSTTAPINNGRLPLHLLRLHQP